MKASQTSSVHSTEVQKEEGEGKWRRQLWSVSSGSHTPYGTCYTGAWESGKWISIHTFQRGKLRLGRFHNGTTADKWQIRPLGPDVTE